MFDISFLVPNLVAFPCYTVNIHLEKWVMRCDTKRAIWWDLYNILGIIGSGNAVSPNRRQSNTWTNVLLSIEPLQHT